MSDQVLEVLKFLMIIVELLVCLLLTLIILVQPSKSGGGLGGAAFGGGGMGEQLFGARAGNVLTKGTILFGIIFLVNTLGLAAVVAKLNDDLEAAPPALEQPIETDEAAEDTAANEAAGEAASE